MLRVMLRAMPQMSIAFLLLLKRYSPSTNLASCPACSVISFSLPIGFDLTKEARKRLAVSVVLLLLQLRAICLARLKAARSSHIAMSSGGSGLQRERGAN